MTIRLKRAYEPPKPGDGYRVLVDRLWPRGVSKDEMKLDDRMKKVAPSDELRTAYHDGKLKWGEFRRRYLSELKEHREELRPLARRARNGTVTLVYSSKETERNNAVVLRQYLGMLGGR